MLIETAFGGLAAARTRAIWNRVVKLVGMKKALVAGDTGIIGRHLVSHLQSLESQWNVVGLSRRDADSSMTHNHVSADLLDRDSLRAALRDHADITHIFYVGRSPQDTAQAEADINGAMFSNVVETANEPALEHVHLMQGMKWYGSHLGQWRTPARENDPRHIPPNMYYTQQDWLDAWAASRSVSWSALRPHQVCGVSDQYPHNAMGVIAVYGALSAEIGLPLRFPGSHECFNSVSMVTDASLLARAMTWCATTAACESTPVNISNGDYFRWANVWPLFADFFQLADGGVKQLSLADFMQDKASVWASMADRHGLRTPDMDNLVNWQYGDFTFNAGWDDMASTTLLRQLGFNEYLDTEEMFTGLLQQYRDERIIP